MTARPGEERLIILFTDVHAFFQAPAPRSTSHRFDKGSYLYLYRNADGSGGRLEVANNVGRPEQDAFTGSLSSSVVRRSHKHPTLCTITVDGHRRHSVAPPVDDHSWRLADGDPRHEWRHLSRLHTVDLYFWTDDDAKSFMQCIERTLQPDQIQILDAPPPSKAQEHAPTQNMSHVVQRLENAAITDGAQHWGSTAASASPATATSVPGMAGRGHSSPKAEDAASYQPLAYNPAAPAAPEPIKHREKTPPPTDADEGTGLAAAAHRDHSQSFSPMPTQSQHSLSQPPYNPSPLQQRQMASPAAAQNQSSLPPSAQWLGASSTAAGPRLGSVSSLSSATGQRASSVSSSTGQAVGAPYPSDTSMSSVPHRAGSTSSTKPQQSSVGFAPTSQEHIERHGSTSSAKPQASVMSFDPPPQDPNAHLHHEGAPMTTPTAEILGGSYVGSPQQPLQHLQPRYADYLGSQPQPQHSSGGHHGYDRRDQHHHGHNMHQTGTDTSDVHNQFYVPDEHESKHHRPSDASSQSKTSRIDKLGNRFLNKLEKRLG